MPRSYLYDAIALLGSYLAMCSHLKEHIVKIKQDMTLASLASDEEYESLWKQLEKLNLIYSVALWERRKIMSKLEKSIDADPHMHCLLKHSIEAFNYAAEVEDATDELWDLTTTATDILNAIISYSTWHELEFCSRCLWDLLLSNKNE